MTPPLSVPSDQLQEHVGVMEFYRYDHHLQGALVWLGLMVADVLSVYGLIELL